MSKYEKETIVKCKTLMRQQGLFPIQYPRIRELLYKEPNSWSQSVLERHNCTYMYNTLQSRHNVKKTSEFMKESFILYNATTTTCFVQYIQSAR